MSEKSFKQLVAEVKMQYNIVDYIQSSGIKLKQRGMKWKGLCPFHTEKTPSFTVDENYQNFRCFGCGESGDLMSFVEKTENLDFFESLKKLAEDKGIDANISGSESSVDYKSLRACIKTAASFFFVEFKKLPKSHPAKQDILKRGLGLENMSYGYAPEGRQTLYKYLKEKGFSDETILLTGVCGKSEKGNFYDFWQGRLMFFITDITGKPIGFSGRKLYETDSRGKYVNSVDGPLFDKGASLFHLSRSKKEAADEKTMFVVEGQFDVASFVEAGMSNVVASSGTAFTEKQGMMIRRLVSETGKIVFAFDGDAAGISAAEKVFKTVPAIHDQSYVVTFPEGQDPCDYRLENGNQALKDYVTKKSVPMIEFILVTTAKDYDLDSTLGRSQYVDAACKVLKTINSASLREIFLKKVALDSFTPVETVREVLAKATPIELSKTSEKLVEDVENKTERPVLDEDTTVQQKDVIQRIKHEADHNVAARLIALTFMEKRFIPLLLKSQKLIPEDLSSILADLERLNGEKTFIPEQFEMSEVVEFIFEYNFFPLAHMMTTENMKEQFKYLHDYLKSREVSASKNRIKAKIARIIEASGNDDVLFFEKALLKEREELEKIFTEETSS